MRYCYIFYTHNTFANYHVDMALESIKNQDNKDFKFDTFIIYNNSNCIDTEYIVKKFHEMGLDKNFSTLIEWDTYPEANSVAPDLQFQADNFINHDWYIVHKSDFYLPNHFLTEFKTDTSLWGTHPIYVNFAKFDLRETVVGDKVRDLAKFKRFDELASQPFACHTDNCKYPQNLSYDQVAIGYRGRNGVFDGVMHCYNDAARKKIQFNSYWKDVDLIENRARGIKMVIARDKYYALHMFHDIGRTDPMKNHPGHRF